MYQTICENKWTKRDINEPKETYIPITNTTKKTYARIFRKRDQCSKRDLYTNVTKETNTQIRHKVLYTDMTKERPMHQKRPIHKYDKRDQYTNTTQSPVYEYIERVL